MYLAKIALDITAKHSQDHIGYLDEELFKETLKGAKTVVEAAGGAPKDGGVPVTVKIRSGWDKKSITWKEAAQAAADEIKETKKLNFTLARQLDTRKKKATLEESMISLFGRGSK